MVSLKPSEAAKLLNVHVKTLQRWDKDGTLRAGRTKTDRRYYTVAQIQEFQRQNNDKDAEEFMIFYHECGINELDEHATGIKLIPGLYYSDAHDVFLCTRDAFDKINTDIGIRDKFDDENYDAGGLIYGSLEDYLTSGVLEEVEVKIPFMYGGDILISLGGWGEDIASSYTKIEDFDLVGDWAVTLIDNAKLYALSIVESDITSTLYAMRTTLKAEMEAKKK